MNYLNIARAVVTGYERNESDEKSPAENVSETECLKGKIITTVTVDPEHFDRAEFERLWALWTAHDAAGADAAEAR